MPDCKRKFSLNFLARFLSGQSYVASQKRDVIMMMKMTTTTSFICMTIQTHTVLQKLLKVMMIIMMMMMKGTETTAMDLDPLLSKSQGFLTELVSPLSSEQIKMPAASESEITYE
ncbi:unnamed protein product [Porites evermanni]|uniref:Uncharacterized protein n=1 Tax=Porites evermanni TaxID=104178 RepID=A0ABN8LQH9_9CNID|nr:unnamed protein product [Porites evermanni]